MILQRYILRGLFATFVMSFLTISLIIFIGIGIQQYRRLEGLGFLFLLRSTPILFCYAVRFSVPASALIASVLVFGRLSADNEIIAIRASGIHLRHVVNPALALGLWVAFGFLLFNDHVAPHAEQQRRDLARRGLAMTLANPPPLGTSLIVSHCRILYKRYRNGIFEDLSVLQSNQAGEKTELKSAWAREAQFLGEEAGQAPRFRLRDVVWLSADLKESVRNWQVGGAEELVYPVDIDPLADQARRYFEMPTPDLLAALRTLADARRPKALAVWNERMAWALGPFVLTLFGAPIGILLRKGSRLAGFGASLPGGTIYFLLGTAANALASGAFYYAIWTGNVLFCLVGLVLLWRVYRI